MCSFDLKSGYHHIHIHVEYQEFLGFQWTFSDKSSPRYFMFSVLPFGLSSAPHVFTKVLKTLQKFWRSQGFNIALFLDDGLFAEYTKETCVEVSSKVWTDLKFSRFITNEEKSIWVPCQEIQ